MTDVQLRFQGSSTGAVGAAEKTAAAIKTVKAEAGAARVPLRGLDGDILQVSRGAVAGSGALRGLGRSVAFASASFLGTAGLVAAVRATITASSDLVEEQNKARTVFRGSQADILSWGKTTAAALGISERAALAYASTFGNLLVPMGFVRGEAEQMSKQLVQLASDLASFNNASPEEVLQALQSALAGEIEPMRRYGVFLNQTRIQQELASKGIHATWTELTNAQKAWAAYQIILKDSADAQGDFARTSDQMANTQRRLKAEVEDAQAKIGNELRPEILALETDLADWLEKSENVEKVQRAIGRAVSDLGTVLGDVHGIIDDVDQVTGSWQNTLKILLALKVGSSIAGWLGPLSKLIGTAGTAGVGGTGLVGADAGAAGLLARLTMLGRLNPLTIPITLLITSKHVRDATGRVLGDFTNKQLSITSGSDWRRSSATCTASTTPSSARSGSAAFSRAAISHLPPPPRRAAAADSCRVRPGSASLSAAAASSCRRGSSRPTRPPVCPDSRRSTSWRSRGRRSGRPRTASSRGSAATNRPSRRRKGRAARGGSRSTSSARRAATPTT